MRIRINQIDESHIGKEICIKGWVRSVRDQKTFAFIMINDGSNLSGIQVVADADMPNFDKVLADLSTGASVAVTGQVVQSPGKGQSVEIKAQSVDVIGLCPDTYPLQKKRHTFEYLRTIAHLRPRTNTLGAVARVRSALAYATHKFFQENGFLHVHTPLLTHSDCEGAGELFRVTTLDAGNEPKTEKGDVDFTQDFFGQKAFLTVSGQLNAETYACALSDVYTFGPTFRAENSNTSRHLSEFWMIEPEMAFADLNDDMQCAEKYLKFCLKYILEHCSQDMEFFNKFIEKGLIAKLETIAQTPCAHLTYTQAIELLEKSGKKFEWGSNLQSEHERYLAEQYCKKPVFVTDYPKSIKPFYMHVNDDGKTVAAMDLLVPGVGELMGGSQREARLDILEQRMDGQGLNKADYAWYLDLRRFGSVPHAGFGLGFERLIQFATGMENVRDVIPFPRYPKHIDF